MKYIILSALTLIMAIPAIGQNASQEDVGGFGGPEIAFSTVNDRSAIFIGGRGAKRAGKHWSIGGGGYGLASSIEVIDSREERAIGLGYGGLIVEYFVLPNRPLQLSIVSLIGGGGVDIKEEKGKAFFVFEPGLEIGYSPATPFRLGLGISYRMTQEAHIQRLSDRDFSGLSWRITFRFGAF